MELIALPIKIKDSLPAQKILEGENIFVMTEYRAMHQDIRPLSVLVLNLMPTKIVTETQLLRKLSNTPLQVEVEFLQTASYQPKHVAANHLDTFYTVFDEIKDRKFDGMIITGAPLDYTAFEDVSYWDEICKIMEWSKTHVHCTLHMCWGVYAGLHYHYGINKIDLPSARPEEVAQEIEDVIGIEAMDAPRISAKTGLNIEEVLEQIVTKIPAPAGDPKAPLKALIFDALYDSYKGVIVFCRIKEGTVKVGTKIKMMATGAEDLVTEVGYFGAGQFIPCDELSAGMVGYIAASIKNVRDTRVGDTVTELDRPCAEPLPGYKKVNPMVYCGLYPADSAKYPDLRDALEKLQVNDASLQYEPETSLALGFGFRCGFLGLLHLEIIQERLEREFNLDLVTTAPGVIYKVHKTNGEVFDLTNPSNLPDPSEIEYMEEPFVSAEIMVTSEYVGAIMKLCQERRGIYISMDYIEATRAVIKYDMPLNEIIYDFFDALKSRSRGYASFDYEMKGYVRSDLVKLDILINKEMVDALSFIVFKDSAYDRGRKMCERLKEEIPRHLFEIPIQAAVNGKVIARETVKAMRKDVLAKCYGGDISRKKKLLEKQKEGKKRMRQVGSVEVPQEAFMSVLKLDED